MFVTELLAYPGELVTAIRQIVVEFGFVAYIFWYICGLLLFISGLAVIFPGKMVFVGNLLRKDWIFLALISILNAATAKYPPPANRRNIRRRILTFLLNRAADGNRKEKLRHSIRCMPGDRINLYRWLFAQIKPVKTWVLVACPKVPLTKPQ